MSKKNGRIKLKKSTFITLLILIPLLSFSTGIFVHKTFFKNVEETSSLNTNKCIYKGNTYDNGSSFEADDGCNTCSCKDGEIVCTMLVCDNWSSSESGVSDFDLDNPDFQLIGEKDNALYPYIYNFYTSFPDGTSIDNSKSTYTSENDPEITIKLYDGSLMTFKLILDVIDEEIEDYEPIFKHKQLGQIFRIKTDDNKYVYSNIVKENGPCDYENELGTNPPCGLTAFKLDNSEFLQVTYLASSDSYDLFDDIIKTLTIKTEKL